MRVRPKLDYKKYRRRYYMPVEDQIDAIVKCLKHLEAQGLDIGLDIQKVIEHRDAVKTRFPDLKHD